MNPNILDTKTEKKTDRHKFDRYDSPHWFITHALKYIEISGVVGEPCKGSGNLSELFPYIKNIQSHWTNDIDEMVDSDYHLDAANPTTWQQLPEADWIITNPPFNAAFPILTNAYDHARIGIIMFLRLSFQEPTAERGQWLHDHPRYIDLVYPRFKFRTGKGASWQTDSAPIIAMVWRKDTTQQLSPVSVPRSHIAGFHDNPLNAPNLYQKIEIIKTIQP